ncbi:MAG: tRNA(Met) cytidine acetyltransferase [Gammaproteobacteria bacterium]|nr:tRNA(Met) cytidine acetyltransferase [Gammaproteobacteria bacterium]
MPKFQQWTDFSQYWQHTQLKGDRGLLVLEEMDQTYTNTLPALLGDADLKGVSVNLLEHHIDNVVDIQPSQAKQYLGRCHNLIIYRACDEFNINSFAALCGTLVAASVAILIIPANDAWAGTADQQSIDYGIEAGHNETMSPFKLWWQHKWQGQAGVMLLSATAQALALDCGLTWPPVATTKNIQELDLTRDQYRVVDAIVELTVVNDSDRRLIWLNGSRGRGKSVALAYALNKLAQQGVKTLVTSAASQSANAVLRQHRMQSDYIAIDRLLELGHDNATSHSQLLVIEEAASLPLALLDFVLSRFERVLLVSSRDGYEGTGQGLNIKLPVLASKKGFNLTQLTLTEAMRWHADDALEKLINDSFLAPSLPQISHYIDFAKLNYRRLGGAQLALEQSLLNQVYGLLALAHYQTTPQDLRLLLDHPSLTIHCWLDTQANLIGVACVMAEGDLSSTLSLAVAQGKRRIKGHVLAQILAQQAGIASAAELTMQRIQRIAVHPNYQQQGLGKAMLKQLQQWCFEDGHCHWLGASFAAEPQVVRFWQGANYQPVWAGKRLDAATGLPSLQVVLPLTDEADKLCQQLRGHWRYYLGHLSWNSSLSQSIKALLPPSYYGVDDRLLIDLADQVAFHQGNVFAITPYLYQYLLGKQHLSDDDKHWLLHIWQPHLTHKQFIQLSRLLVKQAVQQQTVNWSLWR